MKRIIGGMTYNTETATKIAVSKSDCTAAGGARREDTLYQTRGGAFFLHQHEVFQYQDRLRQWKERDTNEFCLMTRDEAHEWVMKENTVELLSDVFGEPPEASAEPTAPEATIYARVPLSLKNQVEALARNENLSVNSFVIRCLESCAASRRTPAMKPNNALLGIASSGVSATPSRNALYEVGPGASFTATQLDNALLSTASLGIAAVVVQPSNGPLGIAAMEVPTIADNALLGVAGVGVSATPSRNALSEAGIGALPAPPRNRLIDE